MILWLNNVVCDGVSGDEGSGKDRQTFVILESLSRLKIKKKGSKTQTSQKGLPVAIRSSQSISVNC